jgi:GDP-L-fucose synthase
MINKNDKIFVAGHNGLIGSAIVKQLKLKGYKNIITIDKKKLNLTNQDEVFKFFKKKKPKATIIAAAKVGGIYANNTFRAEYIYENLAIQNNLIHGSYINGIKELIFLGSSCIYPRLCPQPIKEKYLLSKSLEKTNESYAVAKISGVLMCQSYNHQYKTNYKCIMPANSYGPGDNYDKLNSHFFPALIKKVVHAKKNKKKFIKLWGNGQAKRELIFNEDVADACVYFLNKKTKKTLINIGTGKDKKVVDYARFIMKMLSYKAQIKFDRTKPNGVPRKLLDVSLAKKYGWKAKTDLETGFWKTYQNFINNYNRK